MDEATHQKILQAVVVEVLHQVGFERVNRQALKIFVDLVLASINRRLAFVKSMLEAGIRAAEKEYMEQQGKDEDSRKNHQTNGKNKRSETQDESEEVYRILRRLLIEDYAGPIGSYRRDELVAFLHFQNNAAKQVTRENTHKDGSLLEVLRVGDAIKVPAEGTGGIIDFTGEEEEKGENLAEEKKYADKDVQEYLEKHGQLLGSIQRIDRPPEKEPICLDTSIVRLHREKKSLLRKEHVRDYEHMLNQKRLSTQYYTASASVYESPLLDDLLLLSAVRRVKRLAVGKPEE